MLNLIIIIAGVEHRIKPLTQELQLNFVKYCSCQYLASLFELREVLGGSYNTLLQQHLFARSMGDWDWGSPICLEYLSKLEHKLWLYNEMFGFDVLELYQSNTALFEEQLDAEIMGSGQLMGYYTKQRLIKDIGYENWLQMTDDQLAEAARK